MKELTNYEKKAILHYLNVIKEVATKTLNDIRLLGEYRKLMDAVESIEMSFDLKDFGYDFTIIDAGGLTVNLPIFTDDNGEQYVTLADCTKVVKKALKGEL